MKRSTLVTLALLCALVGWGLAMAGGTKVSSEVGVFLQPDASCPPANLGLYGPCLSVLSTDPVVCGYSLFAYGKVSKSQMKKLAQIGYFVALRGTIEGDACGGKLLFRFKDIRRDEFPPCPTPQGCP
jgi:hypothetical protein